VIIDGGKGQLSAAAEALHELNVTGKTTLAGLAKNVEEILFYRGSRILKTSL
jgi:excinuclease ABC subunit C